MTEPDLSFINADINLEHVKPLDSKRVVAFVNYFVMKTTHFLNAFAGDVEARILEMENRMERVETQLLLLEAKVDSVAGMSEMFPDVTESRAKEADSHQPTTADHLEAIANEEVVVENGSRNGTLLMHRVEENTASPTTSSEQQPHLSIVTVREDARYAKYFKMLRMGVVEAAVKQKMASEGVDPLLLDNPNAPSEGGVMGNELIQELAQSNDSTSQEDESDAVASFSDTE
ncbi:unnamed protein product [Toxocara canis]|uniref:WASH complex subunit CCDC53 n=1 Tax=Toxocara canis TaxID=6265 RepID=A0A183UQC4_TOXCA|nr:unnamed protein product [Toxocara canis]